MRHAQLIIISFFFYFSMAGQIEVRLSIENETISGTDYLFDIYFQRISPALEGNIYLGNSDLVIAYNTEMFTDDSLSKATDPPVGFCTLTPTSDQANDILLTRINYFDNSDPTIQNGNLVINLNGPTPGDAASFNGRVARIDGQSNTHRLGRFKISSISDATADANLRWKTTGTGLKTMVFSLDSIAPFMSHQIDLQTDTNTCPEELVLLDTPIQDGVHQASVSLTASGQIQAPSSVLFRAGQSVELIPLFNVDAGSTLEINIAGCQ
ncbi:MAG: hypothetical protein KDC80_19365 [Saprospiraceae bacterium]|nr:hypothetical protein [Saprospiraceae bacterium]